MTKQKKPMLVARLFVARNSDLMSEYAHINVRFNYVEGMSDRGTPVFPLTLDKSAIERIEIHSQCDKHSLLNDNAQHYGFAMHIDSMKLIDAESLVKEGKKIRRRIDKLQEKYGNIANYLDYLRYFFDAAGVTHITLQEKHEWRLFEVKELSYLFSQCDKIARKVVRAENMAA